MKERKRKRKDKGRRLVKGNGEKKRRRYSFLAACSVVSCKPLECLRYRSPRDDVRFFSLSSDHCPPSYIRYVPPLNSIDLFPIALSAVLNFLESLSFSLRSRTTFFLRFIIFPVRFTSKTFFLDWKRWKNIGIKRCASLFYRSSPMYRRNATIHFVLFPLFFL